MGNIFKRIFRIGTAEANAVIDKFEDPIKLTEQGIRDLKKDLENSIHSLAEVKAMAIRAKRESENQKEIASNYEKKAVLLLQKAQRSELDPAESDRLAGEALAKKETAMSDAVRVTRDYEKHQSLVNQLEGNIRTLKTKIGSYENELTTLKARAKVSQATKKLNKQLAQIDSSDTISMLEKMKSKVEEDETLAESYGEIALGDKSIDDEINSALGGAEANANAADSLAALKAKMGM